MRVQAKRGASGGGDSNGRQAVAPSRRDGMLDGARAEHISTEAGLHDGTEVQMQRWWRCHRWGAKLARRRKCCLHEGRARPSERSVWRWRRESGRRDAGVTRRRWAGKAPRFAVLQLVTPHSPCQSCRRCSSTRSATGKPGAGESISDLLPEARRRAHLLPLRRRGRPGLSLDSRSAHVGRRDWARSSRRVRRSRRRSW